MWDLWCTMGDWSRFLFEHLILLWQLCASHQFIIGDLQRGLFEANDRGTRYHPTATATWRYFRTIYAQIHCANCFERYLEIRKGSSSFQRRMWENIEVDTHRACHGPLVSCKMYCNDSLIHVCWCVIYKLQHYVFEIVSPHQLAIYVNFNVCNQVLKTVTSDIRCKIQTFVDRCLRYILRIWWLNVISNKDLWRVTGQEDINLDIRKRKLRWIGHTLRKEDGEIPKAALLWNTQGSRKRGRPKNSWRRSVIKKWIEAEMN